jgi:hypothetical protein
MKAGRVRGKHFRLTGQYARRPKIGRRRLARQPFERRRILMDLGSILVVLALAILTAAFIGRPFLDKGGVKVTHEDRRLSELQAERDRVLAAIEELDMDFAMGKVPERDYRARRAALVGEGAQALRALDERMGEEEVLVESPDFDAQIEAEVARLRSLRSESDEARCPSCSGEIQAGDRYCVHCGADLTAVEAAE